MRISTLLAAISFSFSLALAAPTTPPKSKQVAVHSNGSRKIGLYDDATGSFIGCATTVGIWTIDKTKCGEFIATRLADSEYSISTISGDTCGTPDLDAFTLYRGVFWHCNVYGASTFWITEKADDSMEKDAMNPVSFYDYYRDRDDWRWSPRPWCCIGNPPPQQRT